MKYVRVTTFGWDVELDLLTRVVQVKGDLYQPFFSKMRKDGKLSRRFLPKGVRKELQTKLNEALAERSLLSLETCGRSLSLDVWTRELVISTGSGNPWVGTFNCGRIHGTSAPGEKAFIKEAERLLTWELRSRFEDS
jgi:hypothetical protein